MKQKLIVLLASVVLLISMAGGAQARLGPVVPKNDGGVDLAIRDVSFMYQLRVDGRLCDPGPILWRGSRVYVQLRGFSTCLGAEVYWYPDASIRGNADELTGVATVVSNWGSKSVTIDLEPLTENPTMRVTEMPVDPTFIDLGDMAPFEVDGRTYAPFRAITDVMDFKVDFTPGVPNVISVIRSAHAIPNDGYLVQPQHMTVDLDRAEPFQLSNPPYRGWPFSMATLRAMTAEADLANWTIRQLRADPELKIAYTVDHDDVSIDIRPYDTVNPQHWTFYGHHMIRWFDTQDLAEIYAQDLTLQKAFRDLFKGTSGVAITQQLSVLIGIPAGSTTLAAGTFIAGTWWYWDMTKNATLMDTCLKLASNEKNKPNHIEGQPYLGLLYGPNGPQCLPYFQAHVVDSRGYVN